MNKHLHRLIFNKARGQIMAVAESATGHGGGGSKRKTELPAVIRFALRPTVIALMLLTAGTVGFLPYAEAQIIADRSAPGTQQATVLNAANGVPVVNIQTPSAAGVSRNTYSQFDVQTNGAILNNSRTDTPTQLGGWVQGNPWLATGSARVILNEVNSSNPSQLRGYVEVAGGRAEVVIANPAGVTCDGCGFINASRLTLTTGTPIFNDGQLDGYLVQRGQVTVGNNGLDARQTDYTDLIARAVAINAGLWTNTLKVTAGSNRVDVGNSQATPVAGTGPAPAFAIDVSRLGGMYAGKITLIGTEAGVGVRNAGQIGATIGELTLSADGRLANSGTISTTAQPLDITVRGLENTGTLSSQATLAIASVGDVTNTGQLNAGSELKLEVTGQVDNRGTLRGQRLDLSADRLDNAGTIQQTGSQGMVLSAQNILNQSGSTLGRLVSDPVSLTGSDTSLTSSDPGAGDKSVTLSTATGGGSIAATTVAPLLLADGRIVLRGDLVNSGQLSVNDRIDVSASGLDNRGKLNVDTLTVVGDRLANTGGQLTVTDLSARVTTLDNTTGHIQVNRNLSLDAYTLVNAQGSFLHAGTGDLAISLPGGFDNSAGTFATNAVNLTLNTASLDNTQGHLEHNGAGTFAIDTGRLNGSGGYLSSTGKLALNGGEVVLDLGETWAQRIDLNATTLSNRGGKIVQSGTEAGSITVQQHFDNTGGTLASTGSLSITASSLDNTQGKIATDAALSIRTTQGDLANGGGLIQSGGVLNITAAGAIANDSGQILNTGSETLTLTATSLSNANGKIQGNGEAWITASTVNNRGGTISVLGDLALIARTLLDNRANGSIASGGNLALTAGSLDNTNGQITTLGGLSISIDSTLTNRQGRLVAQGDLTLRTANVDNTGGQIASIDGGLTIRSTGTTTNDGGILQAAGKVELSNAGFSNAIAVGQSTGGIVSGATISLDTHGQSANNTGGMLVATQDINVSTGALTNDGGLIGAGRSLAITATGTLSNNGGRIQNAGTEALTLTAASLNNATGKILGNGGVQITAPTLTNQGGTISAQGELALTTTTSLDNSASGTIASGDKLSISAGEVNNRQGQIAGQGDVTLATASVDNTRGWIASIEGGLAVSSTGTTTNDSGLLQAAGKVELSNAGFSNTIAAGQSAGGMVSGTTVSLDTYGQSANNAGGTLVAAEDMSLSAGAFANDGGLLGTGQGLTITATGALSNNGGRIQNAGTEALALTAASLNNTNGILQGNGEAQITAPTLNNQGGAISALGKLTLGAATLLDNSAGGAIISGGDLAVMAGNVDNSLGEIMTQGALAMSATGALGNLQGILAAQGDVTLSAASVDNMLGQIASINGGLAVTTAGTTANDSGTLQAAGQVVLSNAGFSNTVAAGQSAGGIVSGRTVSLDTHGNLANNAGGTVMSTQEMSLSTGALTNDGGLLDAGRGLAITATGALGNNGGRIQNAGTEALMLAAASLDNTNGKILSNGETQLTAPTLNNRGGTISGQSQLTLTATTMLDNSVDGMIASGGDLAVTAGDVNNAQGEMTAQGVLVISASGALGNRQGILAARGDVTLSAASVDNARGQIASINAALAVTSTGTTVNDSGILQAAGAVALSNAGFSNAIAAGQGAGGMVSGTTVSIDTHGQSANNAGGTLAAAQGMSLSTGALINDGGLIQSASALTIDTHGQALSNRNAASHSQTPGGILTQGSLLLTSGDLDNGSGYIGAQGQLTLTTGILGNSSGKIVGGGRATLNVSRLNNAGGEVESGDNLVLNAGSGRLVNSGGLLRSGSLLSATAGAIDNNHTSGADQGIEGRDVLLTTSALDNSSGAVRADNNLIFAGSGTLDNSQGELSAGNALFISDLQATPTLAITNTGGLLTAGNRVGVSAGSITGNGQILSQGDLAIALTGNFNNGGTLKASHDISLSTLGTLTNTGKVVAGHTLDIYAAAIDNQSTGEISGGTTSLGATGSLTNRGLIDGGETTIAAGTLNNLGSGRIYGDHLSIAAGSLNNSNENAVSPTIAARSRLDLGVGSLYNDNGALIYSTGDLSIGGSLDAVHSATGRAGTIINNGGMIASLGSMVITAEQIGNLNANFNAIAVPTGGTTTQTTYYTSQGTFTEDQIASKIDNGGWDGEALLGGAASPNVNANSTITFMLKGTEANPAEVSTGPLTVYSYLTESYPTMTAQVLSSAPGQILAGGNMTLNASGLLVNNKSQVIAGGALNLQGQSITNIGAQFLVTQTHTGTSASWAYGGHDGKSSGHHCDCSFYLFKPSAYTLDVTETIDVPVFVVLQNQALGSGGAVPGQSSVGNVRAPTGTGTVQGVNGQTQASATLSTMGTSTAVTASGSQSVTVGVGGASAATTTSTSALAGNSGTTDVASTSVGQTVSSGGQGVQTATKNTVSKGSSGSSPVAISVPVNLVLPTTSLYSINPGTNSGYLVATDSRFTNYRTWLGSDYMLSQLALDPTVTQKRLGDGFYEQQLIREQVSKLTGQRFLEGYASDEAQYRALMDAGITYANAWNLRPGVALTAEQIARLTSDIVWLVAQTVRLPDGTTQTVLVPQVYAMPHPGDLKGDGTLLAGNSVNIKATGDVFNSGTVAGRNVVDLNATNVRNLAGQIAGREVNIKATNDIENIGGRIAAREALNLTADRDIRIETTTVSGTGKTDVGSFSRTQLDRVAGLYVTGKTGSLVVSAGRDLILTAAEIENAGSGATKLAAKGDLILGTVQTRDTLAIENDSRNHARITASTEVGTQIRTQGDLNLQAGKDLLGRAVDIASQGNVTLAAGGDLILSAGRREQSIDLASYASGKSGGGLSGGKKSTVSLEIHAENSEALTSTVSGKNVTLKAEQDIALEGGKYAAQDKLTLDAGRDLTVAAAIDSQQSSLSLSSVNGAKVRQRSEQETTTSATGSILVAGGDLSLSSGRDTTIVGSALAADGKATLKTGGDLALLAAESSDHQQINDYQSTKKRATTLTYQEDSVRQLLSTITVGKGLDIDVKGEFSASVGEKNPDGSFKADRMTATGVEKGDSRQQIDISRSGVGADANPTTSQVKGDLAAQGLLNGTNDSFAPLATQTGAAALNTYLQSGLVQITNNPQLAGQIHSVLKDTGGTTLTYKDDSGQINLTVAGQAKVQEVYNTLKIHETFDTKKFADQGVAQVVTLVAAIVITIYTGGAAAGTLGAALAGAGTTTAAVINAAVIGMSSTMIGQMAGGASFDQAFQAGIKAGATSALLAGVSFGLSESLGLNPQVDAAGNVVRDSAGNVQYATQFGADYAKLSALEKLGTSTWWTQAGANAAAYGAVSEINGGSFTQGLIGGFTGALGSTLNAAVGDWAQQNGIVGGDITKIGLHAGIGAVQAKATDQDVLAGAIGGATAEALSPVNDQLDKATGNKLASELTTVGVSILTNRLLNQNADSSDLTAAYQGLQTDRSNRQLHPEEQKLAKELASKSNGKYTEQEVADALRWADNSRLDETASSNTVVDKTTDAVLGSKSNDAIAGTVFDRMVPGQMTTASQPYVSNGNGTLVQNLDQVTKPSADLMGYIQQSTGSTYNWNTAAWQGSAQVSADTTRYATVSANGQTFKVPLADCPAAGCSSGSSIAWATTNKNDQKVLADYQDALSKQGSKDLVNLGIGGAATVFTPISALGVMGSSVLAGGTFSSLNQYIDTGNIDLGKTSYDAGVSGLFGLGTFSVANVGGNVLNAIAGKSVSEIVVLKQVETTNAFYRDGGIADPTKPMSVVGPWSSMAELTSAQANTQILSKLPPGSTITGRINADVENIKAIGDGWQAPYIPGTQILEITTSQPTQYVRVFGGDSRQVGTWVMRAEDVKGLTAEQIASKFSLPQVPSMISDVTIPADTKLNVSVANGISPNAAKGIYTGDNVGGGGVQFQIQMPSRNLDSDWFTNARPLK